jgi:hypothetical protein
VAEVSDEIKFRADRINGSGMVVSQRKLRGRAVCSTGAAH